MKNRMVCIALGLLVSGGAAAQTFSPHTVFGVNDGDSFASSSLADAVFTRFSDNRSIAEFDLSVLDGPVVTSAILSGTIEEAFSFRFGTRPANIEVVLFHGNGAADLEDFDVAGTEIADITLVDDFDAENFSIDLTSELQDVVDAGSTFAGIRFRASDTSVGQVDVTNLLLRVEAIPTPHTGTLLTLAGVWLVQRRRA